MEGLTACAALLIIHCPDRLLAAGNPEEQINSYHSLNGRKEEVEENVT